jgi:hypothetical protein
MKFLKIAFALLLLVPALADARAKKIDDYHWTGVERIVAISDLHGDYERYLDVMQTAGLIDKKGKWAGGKTHLVQTGDITDRGPDSKKIIDHLNKLARQAERKGGYVHMLIGNHEAMNVIGDLRYVSDGEYQAFTDKNSERLQELQWQNQLNWMKENNPEFDQIDLESFYLEWKKQVPLGWVEHRIAWSLNGPYGAWVKDNQVAIKINDTVFLHGGISQKYCKLSLESMTEQAIAAMESFDPSVMSIIDDPLGPVWYRGLAYGEEGGLYEQVLDIILERYGAKRIVVGHTPTGGVVWPRFDQKVVLNDTGIANYYGAHKGLLEITPEGVTAIYGEDRLALPQSNDERVDYLRAVIEIDANNAQLKTRLAEMLAPPVPEEVAPGAGEEGAATGAEGTDPDKEGPAAGHTSGPTEMEKDLEPEFIPSPDICR